MTRITGIIAAIVAAFLLSLPARAQIAPLRAAMVMSVPASGLEQTVAKEAHDFGEENARLIPAGMRRPLFRLNGSAYRLRPLAPRHLLRVPSRRAPRRPPPRRFHPRPSPATPRAGDDASVSGSAGVRLAFSPNGGGRRPLFRARRPLRPGLRPPRRRPGQVRPGPRPSPYPAQPPRTTARRIPPSQALRNVLRIAPGSMGLGVELLPGSPPVYAVKLKVGSRIRRILVDAISGRVLNR